MDGAIVQVYPDIVIYRASAIGGCPRALLAARLQFDAKPTPENFQRIFDRGHEIENIVKSMLRNQFDVDLIRDQEEVTLTLGTFNTRRIVVVGHIDGYTTETGVNEIKGFGKDYLDKWTSTGISAFPRYEYQVSAYCYAMEETRWRFIVYDKTLTTSESDPDRLKSSSFSLPPLPLSEIKARVLSIEQASITGEIMPCTGEYPCPYYYLHDEPERQELTDTAVVLAIAYDKINKQVKEFEKAKKKIAARLIEKLPHDADHNQFANPLTTVKVTFVQNTPRLDQTKAREILVAAEVDESEFMTAGEGEYPRVTVR